MKYLLIITGIGIGHAIREQTIINEILKKDKKAEIKIATYGNAYDYFKNKYKTIEIKGVHYPENVPRFGVIRTLFKNYKVLFNWLKNIIDINTFINKYNPDIVISDWEPLALFIKQKTIFIYNYNPKIKLKLTKSLGIQRLAVHTVYNLARLRHKKTIVPSLTKKKTWRAEIIDLIVRKKPTELPPVKKLTKKLRIKKPPIIVEVGGSKFGYSLIEKIIKIAPESNEDFLIFTYPGKNTKNIKFIPFKENFLEYMKCCKAVITLAGSCTLAESVVYKKPCLSYPIDNHIEQLVNAEDFKNYVLVKDIHSNEKEISGHIKQLLKNKNKIENKLKRLNAKADGASQVFDIISNNI